MVDTKEQAASKRRGRKPSGTAKTATERSQARDKALLEAGGRIISRLRLSPEAAAALALYARQEGADERSVIEEALLALSNKRGAPR